MLPSASMMNPVPAPRRGDSRSRGVPKSNGGSNWSGESAGPGRAPRRRRASRPLVVASMLTTAGLIRSTTSAKLTSDPSAGVLLARDSSRPEAALAGAPAETWDRATPPATMMPTRNATSAVSTTVTMVKRRDISVFDYKLAELLLIHGFDAELFGLLEFGSGVAAEHHIAGLLAHRARHPGAQPFERRRRVLARHRRQRSGQHERLAGQWSGLIARWRRLAFGVHTGRLQARDELAVARFVAEGAHRCGDHRADFGHRAQGFGRLGHDAVQRPEVTGKRRGGLLADVADPERVDQPREIVRLAALDLRDHVAPDLAEFARHGAIGPRLFRRDHQIFKLLGGQMVKVGEVVDQPLLDQLVDERSAKPLDVHRGT